MNALTLVHEVIRRHVGEGAVCIDATAGRGYDTAFLCGLSGESGSVTAFDVQSEAIESTRALLTERGLRARLVLSSHENMGDYAAADSVDCVVFNLGYLPGGDHSVNTRFDSTKRAIEEGLKLLKKGGLMCVSLYYGKDSGYEEHDALLPWLKTLDDQKYQVIATFFYNWQKDPPIPFFIVKN